jgi:hypothetical protein
MKHDIWFLVTYNGDSKRFTVQTNLKADKIDEVLGTYFDYCVESIGEPPTKGIHTAMLELDLTDDSFHLKDDCQSADQARAILLYAWKHYDQREPDEDDASEEPSGIGGPPALIDPYDAHLQFSRIEMDGMLLALIQGMATTWDPHNERGPYSSILDGIAQIACGGKGEIREASNRFFKERIMATIARGVDNTHAPPVLRRGSFLHFTDYVPFRQRRDDPTDNRSRRYPAEWVRAWHSFTGQAKIVEERGASYYCEVLGFEDEDALWPRWDRAIYVPKLDVEG